MICNSSLFEPKPADWCPRDLSMYKEASEWWYHDAKLKGIKDGKEYFCQVMPMICKDTAVFMIAIADESGSLGMNFQYMDLNEVESRSKEHLDLKMGNNYMLNIHPNQKVRFIDNNGLGVDLNYEIIVQEAYEPFNGNQVGNDFDAGPVTDSWCYYMIRPRCKVTGNLYVNNKPIPVEGWGYGDHQWVSRHMPFDEMPMHQWHWGKIYMPNNTLFYWTAKLQKDMGYAPRKWLWLWEGNKLIEYKNDARVWENYSDFEFDPVAQVRIPRKVEFVYDEPAVHGTVTMTRKNWVFSYPFNSTRLPIIRGHIGYGEGYRRYYRYVSEVETNLVINDKKVVSTSLETHEFGL